MKNLIILLLVIFSLNSHLHSQIYKNTLMVGGSLSFNNAKNGTGATSSSFQASPMLGYFFADNFAGGLQVTLSSYKFSSSVSNSYTSFSPFVRYYLKNIFIQLRYNYNRSNIANSSAHSFSTMGTDIGYAVFFNDNVAMEPAFYFNNGFKKNSGINYGFKIGLQVYLNR